MACSKCSKGTTNKPKENTQGRIFETINRQKSGVFNTGWGKVLYFSLCLLLCITPVINLVCLYLFAKLIFNSKTQVNKEIVETDGKIN